MKDLILRIRSEVLKSNIDNIRRIVQTLHIQERYSDIDKQSENVEQQLRAHRTAMQDFQTKLDGTYLAGPVAEALHSVNTMVVAFSKIRGGLKMLIHNSQWEVPVRDPYKVPLDDPKENEPPESKGLDKILTSLTEPANREDAWNTYREIYPRAQRLLSEYLEFLGGLALRDAGLDDGICDLADELVPAYNTGHKDIDYHAMTIPARQETSRMTWARIIRLGSPEWTIWALPLIAHDIWYAMAQERIRAQTKIAGLDVSDAWIQECLADAYGIWATGPAYAYALFFLRLDPFHVYDGDENHASDGERAVSVLQMWNLMGAKDPNNKPYYVPLQQLTGEWEQAVQAAKPQGAPSAERAERVKNAISALFKMLESRAYTGYSTDAWIVAQDWENKMRNREEISVDGTFAELHWVLNAAWSARITEPDKFDIICKQARDLWTKIKDLSGKKDLPRGASDGVAIRPSLQTIRRA